MSVAINHVAEDIINCSRTPERSAVEVWPVSWRKAAAGVMMAEMMSVPRCCTEQRYVVRGRVSAIVTCHV